MSSFSVALPLTRDSADGFRMIKNFKSLIRQNLKMLILTNPGERVMNPNFGVGIQRMLFENANNETFAEIRSSINEQVKIYIPTVQLLQINFDSSGMDQNILGISIEFAIPKIGLTDILEFAI